MEPLGTLAVEIGVEHKLENAFYKALGKAIRERRRQMKMTQADLAKGAGVSPSFIGHIEGGTRAPSLWTVCRIAQALGATVDYLMRM